MKQGKEQEGAIIEGKIRRDRLRKEGKEEGGDTSVDDGSQIERP